jgi:hypothetical protein
MQIPVSFSYLICSGITGITRDSVLNPNHDLEHYPIYMNNALAVAAEDALKS